MKQEAPEFCVVEMKQEAPDFLGSTLLEQGGMYGGVGDLGLLEQGRMYGGPGDLELMAGNSLHIDDLLNFSNEEIAGPIGENDHFGYWTKGSANSDLFVHGNSFSHYHASDFFISLDELAKPVERVSNFAEDSFKNSKYTPQLACQNMESSLNAVEMSSISCVPARPRSKRSRAARDVGSWCSLPSWRTNSNPSSNSVEEADMNLTKRRCLHCGIEKTPQWRAGPMGPKSLCNACGVRYKSGRLLPEYRPAASPTFNPSIHSNSHKNVLHIRRLKHLTPQ